VVGGSAPVISVVASTADALHVWHEAGVRGRVLYHFARRLSADRGDGAVAANTYVFHAMRDGVAREVVHVIPAPAWREVEDVLSRRSGVTRAGEAFHFRLEGVPITVTPTFSIPPARERPVVDVDGSAYDPGDLARISSFLEGARPDVIALTGPLAPELSVGVRR
jgi:hypothetical protein